MKRIFKKLFGILLLPLCSIFTLFAQEDYTKYIDPTIGNVSRFLVPTYPTIQLPNQMLRMFPGEKGLYHRRARCIPASGGYASFSRYYANESWFG